jgi:hypothetical protein
LRFIAFDLLSFGGEDVRLQPWYEPDEMLRANIPVEGVVWVIESQPACEGRSPRDRLARI